MTSRASMCGKKVSFRSKLAAERSASKFGQRIYECPICFCWHCTSKSDWREEFLPLPEVNKRVQQAALETRREFKLKIKELNRTINRLQQENAALRRASQEEA